jgi:hypothetical protein
MEFEPNYVLRVAELQHLCSVEVIEAWDYNHPPTWYLAQAICGECESDAPQGPLYAETAIAFLALHVVKTLSNVAAPGRILHDGGLAPAVLHRACNYMVSRVSENVSPFRGREDRGPVACAFLHRIQNLDGGGAPRVVSPPTRRSGEKGCSRIPV